LTKLFKVKIGQGQESGQEVFCNWTNIVKIADCPINCRLPNKVILPNIVKIGQSAINWAILLDHHNRPASAVVRTIRWRP
jgi:hypothetical protein